MTRREAVKIGLGVAAVSASGLAGDLLAQTPQLILKPIPSSGERIPVVGIGTARRYEVATSADRLEIKDVLRRQPELGGRVIDTAAVYGMAEVVVGDLLAELGTRDRHFVATKVTARGKDAGINQIEQSFKRLKTNRIDLLAVHNLTDTGTQLATLRELKTAGRIRYVGITTSFDGQYADFETVMKAERLDFIQVDYALDNRDAATRILPLAADRGMAVMVNLPFGRGRLFNAVQNRPLPDWTKEIDCTTWAQVFLKYIVSHPAVTVAVPGTARVQYLTDNLGAAQGRLPDAAMRRRMEEFIDKV
jgi:aryl-alcohol dehydrogenase-like predicted oxidoreductase